MAVESPTAGDERALRSEWDEKYRSGPKPWDTRITPPEVKAFWRTHTDLLALAQSTPNQLHALDFGCGPGTNAAYLAGLGLNTVGIEISSLALALACIRQSPQLPHGKLAFIQADVTRTTLHRAEALYILDIGCLHGLHPTVRPDYARHVLENLQPGGYFHLFAFDRTADSNDLRGLAPGELETLFGGEMEIVEAIRSRPDMRPCHWYLLRRHAQRQA